MTVLNVRQIPIEEIHHLGTDLAQTVADDRDELAQHRSLAAIGEDVVLFDDSSVA